ncbi:MAG: asparaginase [Xanthobacteraceae bacterium]
MTRIVVLATGGTIASRFSQHHGAVIAGVSGEELVRSIEGFGPSVEIVVEQFCNVGSFLLTLDLAFRIVRRVDELLKDADVAGVVVTCGTDTMEEIAYLADLVVASEKPVVFTGAQRHAGYPDSDGPRNLNAAVLVAACQAAKDLGALIVFEDEIHAARDATKVHSSRVGTFASAEHGKLGEVDGSEVIVSRRTIRRGTIPTDAIEARIDLIKLCIGADGRFIDYAAETGSKGIVVEAFGRGNATLAVTEAVRRAVDRGLVVAVSTRSPQGRIAPTYTGGGGGHDLMNAGAIFAGDLSGVKTRILLAVLIGAGLSETQIKEMVARRAD